MEELWIGKALTAGIVLALAIGLVFMVTGLIQRIFIWIETFDGKIMRVILNLLVILMVVVIGIFLLQRLLSFIFSQIVS